MNPPAPRLRRTGTAIAMTNTITTIKNLLRQHAAQSAPSKAVFFKTGAGNYAEHDQFIGINVPTLRSIAKQYAHLSSEEITLLLTSPFNEERLLALFIMVDQYKKASAPMKKKLYELYMDHLDHINNWNLVDSSAHLIIGAHLHNNNKEILITLAQSDNLWHRRIAIITTWYFIRHHEYEWTLHIAEQLLNDSHDLIHKAVGWMLREMGERNETLLIQFLEKHASHMPRTMLRYAIEKFPEDIRKNYLLKK